MIFSNWEFFRSIGKFFSQLGRNLVPETGPSFIQRKSPGSIYKGEDYTLVNTTYESSGPYGFGEEDFKKIFMFFP